MTPTNWDKMEDSAFDTQAVPEDYQRYIGRVRESMEAGRLTPEQFKSEADRLAIEYAEEHGIDWRANAERLGKVLRSEKMRILNKLAARKDFNEIIAELRHYRQSGTRPAASSAGARQIVESVVGKEELERRLQRYGVTGDTLDDLSMVLSPVEVDEVKERTASARGDRSIVEELMDRNTIL